MKNGIIGALIGIIAVGGALGTFAATRTVETTAELDVRVWQRVSDGELYISARPTGSGVEGWVTSEALDMSELSQTGRFHISDVLVVEVPLSVEVEVPDAPARPTPRPVPTTVPSDTPVAGPCCKVEGMLDNPAARREVVAAMQDVIDFGLETYGITHAGEITINIAYSPQGLFVRYEDAFGEELEELPDDCSFQDGVHIFLAPKCREDKAAIAHEWFTRALGAREFNPRWMGHGIFDYLVTHYIEGEPPTLTDDRYRRAIFYERVRDIRQDRAAEDLMTVAMLYAITDYGDFDDWRRLHGGATAGLDAAAAFESIFKATLTEFYQDFEEWADHQKIILISSAYASCSEASEHLRTQLGSVGNDRGYPDYRVPLEIDDDGDGIVCEGFIPPARVPIQ